MANIIKLKRSEVANSVPTINDIDVGEVCVNITDQKIYTRKSDDTVVVLAEGITGKPELELVSTDTGSSSGPVIDLNRDSFSPFDSDLLGELQFSGKNDGDEKIIFGKINGKLVDASDASEEGEIEFHIIENGSLVNTIQVKGNGIHLSSGKGIYFADGTSLTTATSSSPSVDLSGIQADILKLAISQAVDGNRVAFSLNDCFIDGFEDDTGIATETTVDRDVDDEYVASVIQSLVETTIAASDWGGGTSGYNLTTGGADQTSSNYSIYTTKTFSGDFTFQADNSWTGNTTGFVGIFDNNELGSFGSYPKDRGNLENMTVSYHADSWYPGSNGNHAYYGGSTQGSTYPSVANGETIKFERVGTTIKLYIGGNLRHTYASHPSSATFRGAIAGQDASTNMTNIKWTETQTTCNSSTGTLVSVTQTASSSRNSVSGVIVYEDEAGTATLGSDFKIYFTADNGSNWTEASSYGTPTTYTGTKKIVSLGNTTVTSGTQIAVKGVWANQSSGSKVTLLHGWAINY